MTSKVEGSFTYANNYAIDISYVKEIIKIIIKVMDKPFIMLFQ